MITFKPGNYIDENKLNKQEAGWFIEFLLEERQRHIIAQKWCDENRYLFRRVPVLMIAYQTSVARHLKDIVHIDKTILFLKQKYNFNNHQLLKKV